MKENLREYIIKNSIPDALNCLGTRSTVPFCDAYVVNIARYPKTTEEIFAALYVQRRSAGCQLSDLRMTEGQYSVAVVLQVCEMG